MYKLLPEVFPRAPNIKFYLVCSFLKIYIPYRISCAIGNVDSLAVISAMKLPLPLHSFYHSSLTILEAPTQ